MENIFKKYGIFILVAICIIFIVLSFLVKGPNDKLKKYLVSQGFVYNSDSELINENVSLENYENDNNITSYNNVTFNYNNSTFYLINRSKEDSHENTYNISYNIVNGALTGDYRKENEYDTWYIETTFINNTFKCNTGGYKGMAEYCDFLEEEMQNFKSDISLYLLESNTNDYYAKKMAKNQPN